MFERGTVFIYIGLHSEFATYQEMPSEFVANARFLCERESSHYVPTSPHGKRSQCLHSYQVAIHPQEIATLLDLTKQRVSNMRRSINHKLFREEAAKTLDSNIRRLKA